MKIINFTTLIFFLVALTQLFASERSKEVLNIGMSDYTKLQNQILILSQTSCFINEKPNTDSTLIFLLEENISVS